MAAGRCRRRLHATAPASEAEGQCRAKGLPSAGIGHCQPPTLVGHCGGSLEVEWRSVETQVLAVWRPQQVTSAPHRLQAA